MKHNFNLNQIILLCENGEVTTDDGTKFQITEVKSETVASDYSHLIGKWVRYWLKGYESIPRFNKWCQIERVRLDTSQTDMNKTDLIINIKGEEIDARNEVWRGINDESCCFDLSNPLDYNPTELVGKYYDGLKLEGLVYNANGEPYFFNAEGEKLNFSCSNITLSEVTDTPPTKSLKYEDIISNDEPLHWVASTGEIQNQELGFKYSKSSVYTERDAKKLRATAQLLVVMHAANGGEWVLVEGEESYGIYYSKAKSLCVFKQEIVIYQIYFRTRELAEKVLADNKQLFNEYFGIDESN